MKAESCPVCSGGMSLPAADNGTFRRCRTCGAVYNTSHHSLEYSDSYFIEDYRAQYGRTYEEDFPDIYRAASLRVSRMLKLWHAYNRGKTPVSVLDIGCALGFFLKAAQDAGFTDLSGIEISAYASARCAEKFGYAVLRLPFEDADMPGPYDAVTAWYFLEHLHDTGAAFGRIYHSLKPGGVAAFSLPSVFGPMFCFNRGQWAQTHPVDHRVDFSPSSIRRALKLAGFRRVKVYPSGIHPERVMRKDHVLFPVFAALYRTFSMHTGFSDTIEVYAVK